MNKDYYQNLKYKYFNTTIKFERAFMFIEL